MPSHADVYTRRFGAHDRFAEEELEPLCDTQREGALQGLTHLLGREGVSRKAQGCAIKKCTLFKNHTIEL